MSMGIILRTLQENLGRSGGVVNQQKHFTEFDDEDEQQMDDEGVYSSNNNTLTI